MNMDSVRHSLHNVWKSTAETVLPVLSTSGFREKGVLTPEEYVKAGDYLVRTCPTWSWAAGDSAKAKSYLPHNKQYLLTRNVPSNVRAAAVEEYGEQAESMTEGGEGEAWVMPPKAHPDLKCADLDPIAAESQQPSQAAQPAADDEDSIPDIDDMQAEDFDEAAAAPPATSSHEAGDDILRTRTYDLLISYDKYYQVPRFWLRGYDEHRHPLQAQQILQDVSEEHARKTITVDPFPHTSEEAASIHPCKHSETMQHLMAMAEKNGNQLTVQEYMVLFLKFIASVIPTIEYDYTMAAGRRSGAEQNAAV